MVEKIVGRAKDMGLSQAAVERSCSLSENRISKWANGQGEPTARQLYRIALLLGCSVDYLIDDARNDPASGRQLTDDERTILDVYRSLRLPKEDAIRALSLAVPGERAAHGPAMPVGPTREDFGDLRPAPARRRAKG